MIPLVRRLPRALVIVLGVCVLVALAVPAVGSISASPARSTTSASALAAEPSKEVATSGAADEPGVTTTSAPAPAPSDSALARIVVTLVDDTRSTPARGQVPAEPTRAITVTITFPASASSTLPLVVFAHGYAASAATYEAMEREVAAAGFVVAAPDFPLSSSALDGAPVRDVVDQAVDVSFVITSLLSPETTPPELAGKIAPGPVAVIGHSDGGITAAGLAFNDQYADARVGAVVVLSGAEAFFPGAWFDAGGPPLLAIHGTADDVNPFAASQALYDRAPGAKWLVAVDGGSHAGPFTTDPVRPAVSALISDFLRAELGADPVAAARIAGDSVAPGLDSLTR